MKKKNANGANAKTFMKTTTANAPSRPGLDRSTVAVVVLGVVGALVALLLMGVSAAVSILMGALIGALNLWAIAQLVPRLMASEGPKAQWAVLSMLKVGALLGLVALLVSASLVELLWLCLGYGALPLGIVVGQLFPANHVHEES